MLPRGQASRHILQPAQSVGVDLDRLGLGVAADRGRRADLEAPGLLAVHAGEGDARPLLGVEVHADVRRAPGRSRRRARRRRRTRSRGRPHTRRGLPRRSAWLALPDKSAGGRAPRAPRPRRPASAPGRRPPRNAWSRSARAVAHERTQATKERGAPRRRPCAMAPTGTPSRDTSLRYRMPGTSRQTSTSSPARSTKRPSDATVSPNISVTFMLRLPP